MPEPLFLLPGEMAWPREPAVISTVLGSCVAVCLYDQKRQRGGMNHFMMPDSTQTRMEPGKCGDTAIAQLLTLARAAGSAPADLVASVYGGGAVIGHLGSMETSGMMDIGDRNIRAAMAAMDRLGIPVVHRETGGTQGRKLRMETATNRIGCSFVQSTADNQKRAELRQRFKERRIGILVVDDSSTVRKLLCKAIAGAADLEVVGEAADPFEARERILECDPDVISLDLIMPNLDGLSFLRRLMAFKPIPVVVVSTIAKPGSPMERKVLEAGAVGVIDKDSLQIYKGLDSVRQILLPQYRNAATTVVRKTVS